MSSNLIVKEKRRQIAEKIFRISDIGILNAIDNILDTYLPTLGYGIMVDKGVMVDSELANDESDFEVLDSWVR